jgi:hypothetical protein
MEKSPPTFSKIDSMVHRGFHRHEDGYPPRDHFRVDRFIDFRGDQREISSAFAIIL